jgi:phospholipase D1/2
VWRIASAASMKRTDATNSAVAVTEMAKVDNGDAPVLRNTWPIKFRIVAIAATLTGIAVLGLAWRFSPLHDRLDATSLSLLAAPLAGSPWLPLAVLAAFFVGGLIVIPLTLMIAATGLMFGPLIGGVYALTCATLSAVAIYLIGSALGRDTLRQVAGARINALSRRLATRGVSSVFLIRVLPIAPFTLVNLVAGASHIRLRDFVVGTLLGLAPGTILIVIFVDRVADAARRPGWLMLTVVLIAGAAVFLAWLMLRRRMAQAERDSADLA